MRNTNIGRWFILALTALGLGGTLAFMLGMSRAPFVSKFFPENYFRHALVGHVDLVFICWLIMGTILLWNYHIKNATYHRGFTLAVIGVACIAVSSGFALGEPYLVNYVPTIVHPIFFVGIGLFFTAFGMNCVGSIRHLDSGGIERGIIKDIVATSLLLAVILGATTLGSFLLYGGETDLDPQVYFEQLYWVPGHVHQFLNGSLIIMAWYTLLKISTGKEPSGWKPLRIANGIMVIGAGLFFILQIFYEPMDEVIRSGGGMIYGIFLGIPVLFHMVNIIRQYRFKSSEPASVALLLSMMLFSIGVAIAYNGMTNDTRVPAHYHGVISAITLAIMGFAYHLMKDRGLTIRWERAAKLQPYLYGFGMVLFCSGLFISGMYDAPRKTFGTAWAETPGAVVGMGFMGVGTLIAVIGGAIFVLYSGLTILKENKKDV